MIGARTSFRFSRNMDFSSRRWSMISAMRRELEKVLKPSFSAPPATTQLPAPNFSSSSPPASSFCTFAYGLDDARTSSEELHPTLRPARRIANSANGQLLVLPQAPSEPLQEG